jgi:uncharacterized NAD(P)/FAD-binding protein YdhS
MKIAIVGVGYTGTALFTQLFSLVREAEVKVEIDLYEKSTEVGAGLAYQHDVSSNLLNRPAKAMYLNDKNDFLNWVQSSENASDKVTSESFLQRSVFGDFLKEKLNEHLKLYKKIGHSVILKNTQVNDIMQTAFGWQVMTGENSTIYDTVFLCTGTSVDADPYQLSGTPRYISNPYPVNRLNKLSGKIGIIGCRLTAYDVVMGIDYSKTTSVEMFSRVSSRPRTVGYYHDVALKYLSKQGVAKFIESRTHITLESVINLINKELKHQGINTTLTQLISSDSPKNSDLVTSIFVAANYALTVLWQNLSAISRQRLMQHFQQTWANMRVPISLQNHLIVEQFIANKQVVHRKGVQNISFIKDKYSVEIKGEYYKFDHIINATGINRTLDKNNPVLNGLLRRHLAIESQYGGIQVCPKSCSVLSIKGIAHKGLFALGQITCGDFYMVNNIDVINKQITALLAIFEMPSKELV